MNKQEITPELLEMLVCPETKQAVALAEQSLIDKLNEKVSSGSLSNESNKTITESLEAGLIREDGKALYPIRGGIPVMLVEERITLS